MKYWHDHASYPFQSHELWFLTEDIRWGKFEAEHRHQGADHQGQPRGPVARRRQGTRRCRPAEIPTSTSRGKETFFDGKVFDPANPTAYLKSLADQAHRSLTSASPVPGARSCNMPAEKTEAAMASADTAASVLPLDAASATRWRAVWLATRRRRSRRIVVPPLLVIALLLVVWELLCRRAGATLPPPSTVLTDTWELIVDPFFDRGGIDKGLFWHLSASLQRVALGYALAAVAGIALGTLVGQSIWAMRGLDPIFQVLRTVPPLAWLPLSLAAFRDGQPSAIFVIFITAIWPIIINTAVGIRNIPQDYRNVARGAAAESSASSSARS